METVVVLGASNDKSKYAYKAVELLIQHNHNPIPVHPTEENKILGKDIYKSLDEVSKLGIKVDTITMYVNPKISQSLTESILKIKPRRVIFNPGTENPELESRLVAEGIKTERACTLVLLNTNQY